MEETRILYFKKAMDQKYKAAFDWAVRDQKRHGFHSKPINFEFDGDSLEYDENVVHVAMFYDEDQNWAILRRDWPEKLATTYNIVANIDEVKKKAPNSMLELLNNGLMMYDRYKKNGFAL